MKKFVKYLLITPASLLAVIPTVSCGCSKDESSKDVVPEDKLVIKNGVLSGFVDGFDPKSYKSLVIPSSVHTVSANAFATNFTGSDCLLTSITIPNSVKTIETKAFYGNTSIVKYDLSSFTATDGYSWASDAFGESSTVYGTLVYPENAAESLLNSLDYLICDAGLAINWFDTTRVRVVETKYLNIPQESNVLKGFTDDFYTTPHTKLFNKLEIPYYVTKISDNAFFKEDASTLTTINTIQFNLDSEEHTDLTEIGKQAFKKASVQSIKLAAGIVTIDDSAFEECTSLEEVEFPYSLTNLGACAFKNCSSLTSVTFPIALSKIGDEAFANCTKLSLIELTGIFIVSQNWSINKTFDNISTTGKIICEPSIAQDWKTYFTKSGGIIFSSNDWTITDKNNILNGYTSLVDPFVGGNANIEAISARYFGSVDSVIQILIDDLYHTFFEWTKTVANTITLTKLDMLIKNASVDTDFKTFSFNVYYDIAGTVKATSEEFSASGNWRIKELPFNIATAETKTFPDPAVEGEEPRKYLKMVDKSLNAETVGDDWYAYFNEEYTINGVSATISNKKLNKDKLADYPSGFQYSDFGILMAINQFFEKDASNNWTWGILSAYLQNIVVVD